MQCTHQQLYSVCTHTRVHTHTQFKTDANGPNGEFKLQALRIVCTIECIIDKKC